MKLHVGCGTVYLRDWVNVDLPHDWTFLASERPDLVERWITCEDRYYARHENKTQESLRGKALTQEGVCDRYGSFEMLPVRASSVSEILSRQVFEHLSIEQAIQSLGECHRVLDNTGELRLDIPDPDETLRLYRKTGDEFYIRHLFGPRLNEYGFHTHYTRKMLCELAESSGFSFDTEEPNPHFYPAFTLRFYKS